MRYKADYSYRVHGITYTDYFCVDADDISDAYERARVKLLELQDNILLLVSLDYNEQLEFDFL